MEMPACGALESSTAGEDEVQLAEECVSNKVQVERTYKLRSRKRSSGEAANESYMLLPATKRRRKSQCTTKPFSCDICKATSVIKKSNPRRSATGAKGDAAAKRTATRRYKVDPETGNLLTLCNACGLKFGREKKQVTVFDKRQRDKHLADTRQLVRSLVNTFKDDGAACLCCTNVYKTGACSCVQKLLCGESGGEINFARAHELLQLSKEAERLAVENHFTVGSAKCIGLGGGHKRSENYVTFVQEQRQRLREDLCLCEKATQKILHYSNNFLYKKLKTAEGKCRVKKIRGKLALGKLKPIAELADETCCRNECVELASSESTVLEDWRCRYSRGQQAECRLVVSEMLSYSKNSCKICVKFIQLVTGASLAIVKVVQDMMEKGGNGWMHKLRKLNKRKPQREMSDETNIESDNSVSQEETQSPQSDMSDHQAAASGSVVQCPDNVTMAIQQVLSSESNDNEVHNSGHSTSNLSSPCLGPSAMELFAAEAATCINQEHNGVLRQDSHQTRKSSISNSTADDIVEAESGTALAQPHQFVQASEDPFNSTSFQHVGRTDCCMLPSVEQTDAESLVSALETLVGMASNDAAINSTTAADEVQQTSETNWLMLPVS